MLRWARSSLFCCSVMSSWDFNCLIRMSSDAMIGKKTMIITIDKL